MFYTSPLTSFAEGIRMVVPETDLEKHKGFRVIAKAGQEYSNEGCGLTVPEGHILIYQEVKPIKERSSS